MNVVICGSRIIRRYVVVETALDKFFAEHPELEMTELISGAARGVDTLAENWAIQRGIPVQRYPALWGKFGIGAGFRRNLEMLGICDVMIAILPVDLETNGTKHMITNAKKLNKKYFVLRVIP